MCSFRSSLEFRQYEAAYFGASGAAEDHISEKPDEGDFVQDMGGGNYTLAGTRQTMC